MLPSTLVRETSYSECKLLQRLITKQSAESKFLFFSFHFFFFFLVLSIKQNTWTTLSILCTL